MVEVPSIERGQNLFLQWAVTKDKDGADEVLMGRITFKAGSADLVWTGRVDEIFYCFAGNLRATYDDSKGSKGEMTAGPGEVLFLPRGWHYQMNGSGIETLTVFCKKA